MNILDELKNKPHLLILKTEREISVLEFTGDDAMDRANDYAKQLANNDYPGCITVAVRTRQLCPLQYEHLMTT